MKNGSVQRETRRKLQILNLISSCVSLSLSGLAVDCAEPYGWRRRVGGKSQGHGRKWNQRERERERQEVGKRNKKTASRFVFSVWIHCGIEPLTLPLMLLYYFSKVFPILRKRPKASMHVFVQTWKTSSCPLNNTARLIETSLYKAFYTSGRERITVNRKNKFLFTRLIIDLRLHTNGNKLLLCASLYVAGVVKKASAQDMHCSEIWPEENPFPIKALAHMHSKRLHCCSRRPPNNNLSSPRCVGYHANHSGPFTTPRAQGWSGEWQKWTEPETETLLQAPLGVSADWDVLQ